MIDSLPPTLSTDRAVPSVVTNDRAIPGSDQPDKAAGGGRQFLFGEAPEPLNRRGRRHLAGEMRRTERRIFRSLVRQQSAERAAR